MDIGKYGRETSFINFSSPAFTSPGWGRYDSSEKSFRKKNLTHFISSPLSIFPPDAEAKFFYSSFIHIPKDLQEGMIKPNSLSPLNLDTKRKR